MANVKGNKSITIKQTGSLIGQVHSVRSTIRGLGLGKINSAVTLEANPSILGMVKKVNHLVQIVNN